MQKAKALILFSILISLLITACNEDEDSTPTTDEVEVETIQDVLYAQSQFDDAIMVADEAVTSSNVRSRSNSRSTSNNLCAEIILDTANTTLVLDFGAGCTGAWGRERAGKITIVYERITLFQGITYSMTFENYVSEGVTINGTISVDGFTRDDNGDLFYRVTINGGMLEFPDGETISHTSDRIFTWTEGEGNQDITDNIFELTGSYSGTTTDEVDYQVSLETPLLWDTNCFEEGYPYASSGIIEIQLSTLRDNVTLDFGDGACDAQATYTYRGRTETINLR